MHFSFTAMIMCVGLIERCIPFSIFTSLRKIFRHLQQQHNNRDTSRSGGELQS